MAAYKIHNTNTKSHKRRDKQEERNDRKHFSVDFGKVKNLIKNTPKGRTIKFETSQNENIDRLTFEVKRYLHSIGYNNSTIDSSGYYFIVHL